MIPTGEHAFSPSAGVYLNPQDTGVWQNPRGDAMPAAGKISSLALSQVWSHCLESSGGLGTTSAVIFSWDVSL